MIKILDRYILQTFLVSFAIVLAAMMGLSLLLDLFINVGKFLDLSAEAGRIGYWGVLLGIGDYYFYRMFEYIQLEAAPSLLVAAAASLVRLSRGRELVGIKAAGVSLYRVLWPMIVVALVVDGFYLLNQELVIPRIVVELSRDPDETEVQDKFPVDFIRDENNNIIYAPIFDPATKEMLAEPKKFASGTVAFMARVRIFLRDSKYLTRGTIEAERAVWDATEHAWRLTKGLRLPPLRETDLLDRAPAESEGTPLSIYYTNVGPDEIQRHRRSDFHRYMSYSELKALAEDPMRGNRRQLQVAMHQHVTGPIMNILLLLLGLPFVAGRDDRNYFAGIGVAMGLVIGVFALSFASTAFGNAGHIGPLLAAWLPVFVVLPASILSMESLRT
jgi:lipopolysaccharide export system permease protein